MRNLGINTNYYKTIIDGQVFIRVVNTNGNGEIINITMLQQCIIGNNKKYKTVLQNDLPYDIINRLSMNSSFEKLSEGEIKSIELILDATCNAIMKNNSLSSIGVTEIGMVCSFPYAISETKTSKGVLNPITKLITNEYGKIVATTSIQPIEIAYVIMDMLEKSDFKSRTFLVYNNTFVRILKMDDDKYMVFYYYLNEENGIMKFNPNYYCIKQDDDKYIIIYNQESEYFNRLTHEELMKITDDFLETIDLKRIYDK